MRVGRRGFSIIGVGCLWAGDRGKRVVGELDQRGRVTAVTLAVVVVCTVVTMPHQEKVVWVS